ncbi:glycosyltransferase family 4 protein [Candidatus Woesebacteria bacterium]|nr:glycosyltransferase family 4 protein [Candidatus Woesebacteria bacterium]
MKAKRIGIDARLYFQTGVGTYLKNLLKFLPQNLHKDIEIYVYVLPQDVSRISIADKRITLRPINAPWHSLAEQTTFFKLLMHDELDLMHFTYFSFPVMYKRPFIATVHDLTPLLFKTGRASTLFPLLYELKYRVFTYILKKQIEHATCIVTPTKTVKKQIVQVYGSRYAEKIQSIYEGVNSALLDASVSSVDTLFPEISMKYYLYVGNFYPHKNVERLLLAHKFIPESERNDLVLVGPDNTFAQTLRNSIESSQLKGVHFLHSVNDSELASLYTHAQAFINPSLSEGFGLPLIEATYFKCPVIASDIPVFKELLGDAYTAFDPTDIQDIAEKLRIARKELPIAHLSKSMSFETMTKQTAQIYSELIHSPNTYGTTK